MIFLQWRQIVGLAEPRKTQTRRLVKDGEYEFHKWPGYTELPIERVATYRIVKRKGMRPYTDYITKWEIGKTYAVQPGRGKKAIWYHPEHPCYGIDIWDEASQLLSDWRSIAAGQGYIEGRTPPVERIRRERLGDISDEDCLAEGIGVVRIPDLHYVCPVCGLYYHQERNAYACLWNHTGGNWERDKDKDVWVLDWKGHGT